MKDWAIAVSVACLALTGCDRETGTGRVETPAALTVEDVLARHVAAMGGAEAVEGLESVRIAAEIVEPEFTVTGDYRARRDGRMRVDIYADAARVFSEGIDAAGGWQQAGDGAPFDALSADGMAALERGVAARFFGLHDLAARGHEPRLLGRETIDGTAYHVVEVSEPGGMARRYFIDPDDWLIDRMREAVALHPDIDADRRRMETVYGPYRPSCGVQQSLAARTVDLDSGEEAQRSRVLAIACNIDPAFLAIDRDAASLPPPES